MPNRQPLLQRRILPDPVLEAYKNDVDRTLIRENPKRSLDERLDNLLRVQRFVAELQRAGRNASRESLR